MIRKMRNYRIIINIVCVLMLFLAVSLRVTAQVHADTQAEGYELLTYDQKTVVKKNHDYIVTLKLTINAPDKLSAVRVQLPSGKFVLTDLEVVDHSYNTIKDGDGHVAIDILPKNETISKGKHQLELHYVIMEYAEHDDATDMFYYDAVPPSWSVPMDKLRLSVELPDDFKWGDLQYFAGQYGTQDVSDKLTYKVDGNKVTMTGEKIPANFGVTFKAELPDGYWEGALDNSWTMDLALLLMAAILILIGLFWVIGGRDPRVKKTRETHPIEGVSPADIGFLVHGHTRIRDVATLIIYLAIRGYLQIVEYSPKEYKLVKLQEPKEEERFIRSVYNTIFEDVYEGRAVEIDRSGVRMRQIYKIVSDSVESGYSTKDMRACTTLSRVLRIVSIVLLSAGISAVFVLTDLYANRSTSILSVLAVALVAAASLTLINRCYDNRYDMEKNAYRLSVIGSILMFIGLIGYVTYHMWQTSANTGICIGIVISAILSLGITLHMKSRAKGNAVLVQRILSLRTFMQSVKRRDVKKNPAADKNYYYEMLPFALQFSVEEIWARKFRWLGTEGSEFYHEDMVGSTMARSTENVTTESIARDLKTFCRTIESEYHTINGRRRLF